MFIGVTLAVSSMYEHPSITACCSAVQSVIDVCRRKRYAARYDFLKSSQRPTATARSSNRARTRNLGTISPAQNLPESDSDGDALLKELNRKDKRRLSKVQPTLTPGVF